MGSGITRVIGFPPANFQFVRPSVLDLRSGTGQTDGRTDRQRSLHNASALWGRGHKIRRQVWKNGSQTRDFMIEFECTSMKTESASSPSPLTKCFRCVAASVTDVVTRCVSISASKSPRRSAVFPLPGVGKLATWRRTSLVTFTVLPAGRVAERCVTNARLRCSFAIFSE